MYYSSAIFFTSCAGVALAHPFSGSARAVSAFPAGVSWDILLSKGDGAANVKEVANENFQVIDIDLFDTDKNTITELKATKQVICYFSAGTKEGWRPDASDFKSGDVGKAMDDWPDETWLNVKSENVRSIMKKRIQKAAANGCTAVDPDNVDGFDGKQDGFNYDKSAYVSYVKFLAQEAKNNNLAIGLKNAVDMIPDVVDVMQFAVNEQCHQYAGECAKYKPFTNQNKAVFNIEYGGNSCDNPSGVKLSTLIKPESQGLNTLGGACVGQNPGTPTNPGNSQSSAPAASAPAASAPAASAPAPSVPASSVPVPTKTSAPAPSPTKTSHSQPTPTNAGDSDSEDEDEDDDPQTPSPTHQPGGWYNWGWNWGWHQHNKGSHPH